MLNWLGLVAILGAWVGYQWLFRLGGVDFYASWIVALLAQVVTIYIFAMLDHLRLGIYLVVGLGVLATVVLLPLALLHKIKLFSKDVHLFDLWMVVFGVVIAVILLHSPVLHYDNYSHWALIAKFLTYTGHLPGATDKIIAFTSYPPATALWMTEWATLIGYHDGVILVAQFSMIWSASYALFAVLRDRSRALTTMVLCFAISLANVFNTTIRFNNLLVDYVLPIVTAAGLAALYAHREQPRWQWVILALFSANLLLIKNSGTFFVVVLVGYGLYLNLKRLRGQGGQQHLLDLLAFGAAVVSGVLPFLWWQRHVKLTFTSSTKHQIDFQAYLQRLHRENDGTLNKIAAKFFHVLADPTTLAARGMILVSVSLLLAWILVRYLGKHRNPLLKLLIVIDLGYFLYALSVLGMYLVSMPPIEALNLAGLARYLASAVVLSLFVAAMGLAAVIDDVMCDRGNRETDQEPSTPPRRRSRPTNSGIAARAYKPLSFSLLALSVMMMLGEVNELDHIKATGQSTIPVQLTKIAQPRTKLTKDNFLLIYPDPWVVVNYYAGYVGRYYYFTDQVVNKQKFPMDPAGFKAMIQQYDYIAVPKAHADFSKLVAEVYGQKVNVGLFRVTATGLRLIKAQASTY
ncbi:ABC transporter permease [Lapidilactobacillus salsurivasis]